MKDYERLARACAILDKYQEKDTNSNLHPDHDIIYLNFKVLPEDISEEDQNELESLRCLYDDSLWFMFISC